MIFSLELLFSPFQHAMLPPPVCRIISARGLSVLTFTQQTYVRWEKPCGCAPRLVHNDNSAPPDTRGVQDILCSRYHKFPLSDKKN